MFSNGTEANTWQENNCWLCWKYKTDQEKTEKEKCRCKTGYEIDLGYITGELSERVTKIINNEYCRYLQEKRPVNKKTRDKEPMTLFEEEL